MQTQYFICHSSFQNAEQAKSAGGTLGIDLVGILGVDIGGASSSTNYQTWRSNFCATNINTLSQNSLLVSQTSKASPAITEAWSKCTETGFFGWMSPTKDPAVFKITLQNKSNGDNHVKLSSFIVAPQGVQASCQPKIHARESFAGSKQWICRRDPKASVAFVANSTLFGPTGAEMPGYIPDAPPPTGACSASSQTGQCLKCEFDLTNFSHIAVGDSVPYTCPGLPAGALLDIYLSGSGTVDGSGDEGTWVDYTLTGPGVEKHYTAAGPHVNPVTIAAQTNAPANGVLTLKLGNAFAQFGDGRVPGHANRPATLSAGNLSVLVVPTPTAAVSQLLLDKLTVRDKQTK